MVLPAIDLERETPLSINAVPKYVEGLTGRRPSLSTVWRWHLTGCRGVKLPTILAGGRRVTTKEAVQLFFAATTAAANGEAAPARTPRQRKRAIEAAERELSAVGI